jgi:hypothetical protein
MKVSRAYADSNSSYDVENAVQVGRLMEEHGHAYYEEACEFDCLNLRVWARRAHRLPRDWSRMYFGDGPRLVGLSKGDPVTGFGDASCVSEALVAPTRGSS